MKPRRTKPDANQLTIEQYLQGLGFLTYRTCDLSPQNNGVTQRKFHPLDLLVLGLNHKTNRVELTLWEIKSGRSASFTNQETEFIELAALIFDLPVPIGIAYDVEQILSYYGWVS